MTMQPATLDRETIAARIPHQGRMCLLAGVDAWDADVIRCRATSHRDADNPLRDDSGLPATSAIEYAAQAMAVHGALLARLRGNCAVRAGMLVSLREVQLFAEFVDQMDGRLDVHAECLYAGEGGAQYAFRVEHRGRLLASGRAAVIHPSADD